MKKLFTALICATMFVGLVGCGSSKSPEESFESIEKYTTKIMLNYGGIYDDYRGLDNKCYNSDGIEKACGRIVSEPDDQAYSLVIKSDENNEIELGSFIKEGKVATIYFQNENGGYVIDKINNSKSSYLSNHDYCTYYFDGSGDNDNICDSKYKGDAEELQQGFNHLLSEIDITENEFKEAAEWFVKEKGNDLIKEIALKKKEQKSLTPNEVNDILSNDYEITKLDDAVYMEDSLQMDTFMYVKSKTEGIVYTTTIYDDTALYLYPNGNKLVNSNNKKCIYSLNDKKIVNDGTCTSENIKNAELIEYNFNSFLDEHKITLDELFNFFKNYK
ncbi:hypothetical protein MKA37_02160 [[Clostridium] innocuum]|nr:hypothetical protein [[Clostridium] innocuum]